MRLKVLSFFLLLSCIALEAQINSYVGGNLQGLIGSVRSDSSTFKPGFGAGASFYYWEYDFWFFKAGIDYAYKSSSFSDYPFEFGDEYVDYPDRVSIEYFQHDISIPLMIYFSLFEQRGNALLLNGSLEMAFTIASKMTSPDIGEVKLSGSDIKNRLRTSVGLGVGYQRQLDRDLYINIYPSYNIDLRAHRPFRLIKLTAEIMFGVY